MISKDGPDEEGDDPGWKGNVVYEDADERYRPFIDPRRIRSPKGPCPESTARYPSRFRTFPPSVTDS